MLLPVSSSSSNGSGSGGSSPSLLNISHLTDTFPRLLHSFHPHHIDFPFALSQCVDLLIRPSELNKTVKIRKSIKNQWARDDPGFSVVLMILIFISACAYCIAFKITNILSLLRLTIGFILFEFLLLGALLTTALRWYINRRMLIQRIHTVEQTIEWAYAWDIHCNSFFTMFLFLSTTQYCLLPILLGCDTFLCSATANTLYLTGVGYYAYITFLGYSALPFIDRPQRLFYPMVIVLLIYILLNLLNIGLSRFFLELYFEQKKMRTAEDLANIAAGLTSNAEILRG